MIVMASSDLMQILISGAAGAVNSHRSGACRALCRPPARRSRAQCPTLSTKAVGTRRLLNSLMSSYSLRKLSTTGKSCTTSVKELQTKLELN